MLFETLARALGGLVVPPLPPVAVTATLMFLLGGALLTFVALNVMFFNWMERKVSAHMQSRLGPMYTGGWHGWAQPIADAVKLLLKEDTIPGEADRLLFILAPFVVLGGAFAVYVTIPLSAQVYMADLNVGIYYIMAIGSIAVVGIIMAGWASNNKWSLYGAMRSAAQIVSYEVPLGLSLLTVIVAVGTLSLKEIVEAQAGGFWHWHLFRNPFTFVAFFLFFIASLAEVNRTPFDIAEAESELVAGFHTEYSGMRFSFFFLAEYANMLAVSGVAAILFLGGWYGPLGGAWAGPLWFFGKVYVLIYVQMWLRWTLPRVRVDQLMYLCWKVLIPLSFGTLIGASVWELL